MSGVKIIAYSVAGMAAIIAGVVLAKTGVLDFTAAMVLIIGGSVLAAILYPFIRNKN